ncbi:MAG: DNA-directed RNA polymerase subunit delta [Bacilli bacterium]
MEKSNLDVAFELVSRKKNPVVFSKLWEEVSQIQGLSEEEAKKKASKFYTALSLDGRFITLGDNTWDLKSRYTFDKVHIDMNEVYTDDSDEVEDEDRSEDDYFNDDDEESEDEDEDEDEDRSSEDY